MIDLTLDVCRSELVCKMLEEPHYAAAALPPYSHAYRYHGTDHEFSLRRKMLQTFEFSWGSGKGRLGKVTEKCLKVFKRSNPISEGGADKI